MNYICQLGSMPGCDRGVLTLLIPCNDSLFMIPGKRDLRLVSLLAKIWLTVNPDVHLSELTSLDISKRLAISKFPRKNN